VPSAVPDPELVRRRAGGETPRRLTGDYRVAHTTLGRWFARPEVARQLYELQRRLPVGRARQGTTVAVTAARRLLLRARMDGL
jgi:hypothetical protein